MSLDFDCKCNRCGREFSAWYLASICQSCWTDEDSVRAQTRQYWEQRAVDAEVALARIPRWIRKLFKARAVFLK
jgi:NMD protein affecting ribosome stability and mRNA decay